MWIKKIFIKMFVPNAQEIAKYAAKGVQKIVNESGKAEVIAKYGDIADRATDVQKWVTSTLKDGQVDDAETAELAGKLEPIFEKLLENI